MESTSQNFGGPNYLPSIHRDDNNQTQLPLTVELPSSSSTYASVTPPESLASGSRDFADVDVGRLSDIPEDDGEQLCNNEELEESPKMVHITPGKITPVEDEHEDKPRSRPRPKSFTAQIYQMEVLREISTFVGKDWVTPDLLILQGDGMGVPVHKAILSSYSPVANQQLAEHPDCNFVYLPHFSRDVILKVVEILYFGETFYTESDRKDVNLVWEAMRQLGIPFNDQSSFYYHPIEAAEVKDEPVEAGVPECISGQQPTDNAGTAVQGLTPQDNTDSATRRLNPDVDQTEETWVVDYNSKETSSYSFSRVVAQPQSSGEYRYLHAKFGEGRRIRRSFPAPSHVNAEKIREEERRENQRCVESILAKHKPIVIDMLDDDDDNNNDGTKDKTGVTGPSEPIHKRQIETFLSSTKVIYDGEVRKLFLNGQVDLNDVKETLRRCQINQKHQPAKVKSAAACAKKQAVAAPPVSYVSPRVTTMVSTDRVVIPPNRPEGTGITFVTKSPVRNNESHQSQRVAMDYYSVGNHTPEMPVLQPVDVCQQKAGVRARKERKFSRDITDIPTIDCMNDDDEIKSEVESSDESSESQVEETTVNAAAVIPRSKVNQHLYNDNRNKHTETLRCCTQLNNEPQPSTSRACMGDNNSRPPLKRKSSPRRPKPEETEPNRTEDIIDELQRLRENHERERLFPKVQKVFVVGSLKLAVPNNVTVDTFVENIDEESNESQNCIPPIGPVNLDSGFPRSNVPTQTDSEVNEVPESASGSGRGRGRGIRGRTTRGRSSQHPSSRGARGGARTTARGRRGSNARGSGNRRGVRGGGVN